MNNLEGQRQNDNLKMLADVDIQEVDPSTLVDISEVIIKEELTQPERIEDYIQQVKNPYCFLSHGVVVKVSFSGKKRFDDCFRDAMLI